MPNIKGTRPTTSITTTGNESHRKRHRSFSSSYVGSGLGWFKDWVFFFFFFGCERFGDFFFLFGFERWGLDMVICESVGFFFFFGFCLKIGLI